jgi:trehalose-phosphatase
MPVQVRGTKPPTSTDFQDWLGAFLGDYHLALFLGYDGVLVPFADQPTEGAIDASMRRSLLGCLRRRNTDVGIVTRRPLDQIRAMVDHPALTYAGNHGLEITGPDLPHFHHHEAALFEEKASALARDIGDLNARRLWTERLGPTLTVHYGGVKAADQSAVAERVREMIAKAGFQPRNTHMALEARLPIPWEDGNAILQIVRTRYGPAWSESTRLVYIAADMTNESTFRLLSGLGITFRVGPADTLTAASRRLPNVDSVRVLLEWIAKRPSRKIEAVASAADIA